MDTSHRNRYRISEFSINSRAFAGQFYVDQWQLRYLITRSEIAFISSHELHRLFVRPNAHARSHRKLLNSEFRQDSPRNSTLNFGATRGSSSQVQSDQH